MRKNLSMKVDDVCGELWSRDFLKLLPSGQGKPKCKSTKSSIVFGG